MKKLIVLTMLLALTGAFTGALNAQTRNTGEDLSQTDAAVKALATDIARKLAEQRAQTVTIGQFSHMGGNSQFNSYLNNQLTGELLEARGRSFTLVSGGAVAQWIVSGEVVRIDGVVRIYARLVRREDHATVSQTVVDLEVNRSVTAMLSVSDGGSGGSSSVMPDEWEPDSWENPVAYGIGSSADPLSMSRTIHSDDHDWFLIEPDSAMSLVVRTTGDMDTYIRLHNADTRDELASDDDGGDGTNAMVRHFVTPGNRYIVEVKGYSSGSTGEYTLTTSAENMDEAIAYQLGRSNTAARTSTQRIGTGRDMFLVTPGVEGMMVLETTGDMDLVMELLDGETYEPIAEDDDSGLDYNARLVQEVERGKSYIVRIRAISSDSEGEYGFRGYVYGE